MTPDQPDPVSDDDATGAPLLELQDFSLSVGDQFGAKVRGKIERRLLAGEFLTLAFTGPLTVFLEFVNAAFGLFGARGERSERRDQ